ncbi:hypothetical protein [Alicycliphilus denitrificans]|nr:hypothetical protein [Alicycliphilus denitrificans]
MAIQKITLTLTKDSATQNNNWVNPANAFAVDGAEMSISRGTAASNWYFTCSTDAASAIPSGGVIVGVEFLVTARVNITSSTPTINAGPGSTTPTPTTELTTSLVEYAFGGPTDTMGVSAASGLATVALNTRLAAATTTTFYVDAFIVNVYVDMPAGAAQALTLTWVSPDAMAFTNPANVATSNNVYATATKSSTSNDYAVWTTNAASVIPANAVILGVQMQVEYKVSTTASSPFFRAGIGELAQNTGATTASPTTSDVTYTFGGPTDNMGAASRADLAKVALRISQSTSTSTTHSVDYFGVTVYWDYPTDGTNCMFFGENF